MPVVQLLLLLLFEHAFSVRVPDHLPSSGEEAVIHGEDSRFLGPLRELKLNGDKSSDLSVERGRSDVRRDEPSHIIPYMRLLKQDMKKYVQPDKNGRFQGSAKWAQRFLDSLVNVSFISGKNANEGAAWGQGQREGGGEALRADASKSEKEHFPIAHFSLQEESAESPYTLDRLQSLAQQSVVARRLYASRILALQGFEELIVGNVVEAAQWLAAALRLDELPVAWPVCHIEAFILLFETLVDKNKDNGICADTCLVLAHLYLADERPQSTILDVLRRAHQASPEDGYFFYLEGSILSCQGDLIATAAALKRAIELGHSYTALFHRGLTLNRIGQRFLSYAFVQDAWNDLEEYILRAPPEERFVCEAHFYLAGLAAGESKFGAATRHYNKGIRAQEERLPCYNHESSSFRNRVESAIARARPCANQGCAGPGIRMCSGCRDILYCSAECQKRHWTKHKKACADVERKKAKTNETSAD